MHASHKKVESTSPLLESLWPCDFLYITWWKWSSRSSKHRFSEDLHSSVLPGERSICYEKWVRISCWRDKPRERARPGGKEPRHSANIWHQNDRRKGNCLGFSSPSPVTPGDTLKRERPLPIQSQVIHSSLSPSHHGAEISLLSPA